jgi:hypothetical protein
VKLAIVVDFIHVLEYLSCAAWCFYAECDAAADACVKDKALAVLAGNAGTAAASVRLRERPPVSVVWARDARTPTGAPSTC